jgi:integrase
VHWRRLYALAAYTLSRAGELAGLRWDAVDLSATSSTSAKPRTGALGRA